MLNIDKFPLSYILGLFAGLRQTELELASVRFKQLLAIRQPLSVAAAFPSVLPTAGTIASKMPNLLLTAHLLPPAATTIPPANWRQHATISLNATVPCAGCGDWERLPDPRTLHFTERITRWR